MDPLQAPRRSAAEPPAPNTAPASSDITPVPATHSTPAPDGTADLSLLARLRAGDESAFLLLVDAYHMSMVRLAGSFVGHHDIAEEVAQDAWLGFIRSLDRFEGRCSLRTWLFRILLSHCQKRRTKETRLAQTHRSLDYSDRHALSFRCLTTRDAGWGLNQPLPSPEQAVLTIELQQRLRAAICLLPPSQRTVITLRDIEGWSAPEVCALLRITEANQRVLLHRARRRLRLLTAPPGSER